MLILRAIVLTLCAVVLSTCGRRPTLLPSDATSPLVIALSSDITTLDPHMSATVNSSLSVLAHLYPALIERDPDFALRPALAQSWQALSPTHWRFELVADARFVNGEPLDAASVKWNLERVLDPANNTRIRPWFEPITRIQVLGPHTLDIHTRTPFAALPAQLSMLLLLPPRWATTHNPATQASSGGAYVLAENSPGHHLRLRRNPVYWRAQSAFSELEFRIIPSPTARVAALLAGEVDLVTHLPLTEVARLRASGRVSAGSVPSTRSVFIKFNTLQPPLNDLQVRRALNHAIDKQAIVASLFDGQAKVSSCQLLTPEYAGFHPNLAAYSYDPVRARALLDAAGVAAGTALELDVPVNYTAQGIEVAQVIAAQLQAVGLDVRLTQLDPGWYMDKYLKARQLAGLSLLTHAWPTLDADGLLSLLHSDSPYAYYRDPILDRWLLEGRSTLDTETRTHIHQQAVAHLCEQAPVLFLYIQPATWASSRRIHWTPRGDDWIRARDISAAFP